MKQIPNDPRKTWQIISNPKLAEVERTELAVNVRIQDGMTNGAGNIVKKISLHQSQSEKPPGITWVQFDHLYTQRIKSEWTPIKPITIQFAVGRNRTAQVVRKQFTPISC